MPLVYGRVTWPGHTPPFNVKFVAANGGAYSTTTDSSGNYQMTVAPNLTYSIYIDNSNVGVSPATVLVTFSAKRVDITVTRAMLKVAPPAADAPVQVWVTGNGNDVNITVVNGAMEEIEEGECGCQDGEHDAPWKPYDQTFHEDISLGQLQKLLKSSEADEVLVVWDPERKKFDAVVFTP